MKSIDLGGSWNMRCMDGSFNEGREIAVTVPGTVYSGLLSSGLIRDPFWRENERELTGISAHDWVFAKEFFVDGIFLAEERVELVFEGLDTLAEIDLNGRKLASTSDMHRTWIFDVRHALCVGTNRLSITFRSPTAYMKARHEQQALCGGSGNTYPGFNYLRKAHSMSGWDWGPVLPDAGIWRPVFLRASGGARIEDVYVTQSHRAIFRARTDVSVSFRVRAVLPRSTDSGAGGLAVRVSLACPDGGVLERALPLSSGEKKVSVGYDSPGLEYIELTLSVEVENAGLWWPNNFGKQTLYGATVSLLDASGVALDSRSLSVGLRTIAVEQTADRWGSSFALSVNGYPFFAMGADYVPEDSLVTRNSYGRTERLIKSAAAANHNCIRVWGGANYPDDAFFDLCDRYGLVVWHDHMMACGVYELDGPFRENIVAEIRDNVKRIRHHACLGLWCGNNEQEEAWCSWGWSERISPRLKADYVRLYEEILPALNRELDPATFYWLSSPSSGGSFDKPNDEGSGDMHNWQVWHGLKPFASYRECFARFMSEFGIQSFPPMRTVESFTLPEDRNIFSPVMESHQKSDSGNAKILHYIGETCRYPKDFSSLVYASQLLQAEGLRYGVEHWRRNRNALRCMGAVYWQLNDCWPVASWSSIDFFGRWKALHYLSRRFFAPVLASACERGTSVSIHVTNETFDAFRGTLLWRLCDDSRTINGAAVLAAGKLEVEVPAFSDAECLSRDFADMLPGVESARNAYLSFSLVSGGVTVSSGSVLFVKAKSFSFGKDPPRLEVSDLGDSFAVAVSSSCYARFIELSLDGLDALFSDNYFDLAAGDSVTVTVRKDEIFSDSPAEGGVAAGLTEQGFTDALKARSLADTY